MNIEDVKVFLKSINFIPVTGVSDIWRKEYISHNYAISVLFADEMSKTTINYGESIICGRKTTCNFSQPESIVVLECVNRLLEKGYHPSSIELEKSWKVGGYLDIYVKDNSGNGYLMIECKQYGKPYDEAKKIILTNNYKKEQLFNYFLNDKNPQYLLLYTSSVSNNGEIIYKNDIICTEKLKTCPTQQSLYDTWDKNFITKAIFEDGIAPYKATSKSLLKGDLKPIDYPSLKADDNEGSIYNLFAEILRRHSVSDKSNAYDKIFNLFLCKIVDEDNTSDEEELAFQWKSSDTPESVLGRLNDLYTRGMTEYLKLIVSDVTEEAFTAELDRLLYGTDADGSVLKRMFNELRLYRNNAFAFKEIIDKKTFLENAEIIKSVVLLLQPYKIRYNQKQQYLSEFFERLLNIGIKQESGQFFTPIPIASFICKSLDIEETIKAKIEKKDNDFLPFVIDYACGSGHFLTEITDRIDKIVQTIDEKDLRTKLQKDNLNSWKHSYKWATKFIYGVEKDYRLAKTTKVATFLNGDGDANIMCANGLDSFTSQDYFGLLHTENSTVNNPVFDIIVANPPYTVSDFKLLLPNANSDFELAQYMSNKSDDIECLFIERTKQLLKCNGRAGIILPSTILINLSNYYRARSIILKYFKIVGIADFGKNTFALTGQNTVALFLIRRPDEDQEQAKKSVDSFFKKYKDFNFCGSECVVTQFIEHLDGFSTLQEYIDWAKKLSDDQVKIEKEKLFYYLLSFNQQVVITHYGNNATEEKEYLGYEHSSMKNYEGIHPYPYNESGEVKSILFDNGDKNSIADIIRNNFRGNTTYIPDNISKYVEVKELTDMISFSDTDFCAAIYVVPFINPFDSSTVPMKSLQSYIDEGNIVILDSMRKPIKKSKRKNGDIPYYGANGIAGMIDDYIFDEKLLLIGEDGARWASGEDTSIIIEGKSWVNNHAHVLRINEAVLKAEYLQKVINYYDFSYLKSRPNGGKLLQSELRKLEIPNISSDMQDNVIKNCKISDLKNYILEILSNS